MGNLLEKVGRASLGVGESPDRDTPHANAVIGAPPARSVSPAIRWTLMISQTAAITKAEGLGSSIGAPASNRPLGIFSILVLSAWCGLIAGLLEVGTIVLRKHLIDPNHLFKLSRHFVWLIPASNVCVFATLGVLGCAIALVWPDRGRWLLMRHFVALFLLPLLLVAFPRIYGLAWFVVTLGLAARLVPFVERHGRGFRRFVRHSFTVAVLVVAILAGSLWSGDRSRQASESARPLPPPGSPNVLLIVLDTVAAGHLGMYGYNRATSTTLTELAERGIRFDSARAGSSWTLPSHATMFTGRWLHELSVGWLTPLDQKYPTLAEFLGARGYATAGFVANTFYCGPSSGLARGFTRLPRFHLSRSSPHSSRAVLVSRALRRLPDVRLFCRGLARVRRRSPLCSTRLARHLIPIARGRRKSIPSCLAGFQPHAIGSAVFRFLELLRCSLSLSIAAGKASSFRGRARPIIIIAS